MNLTKKQRLVAQAIRDNPAAANDDAALLAEVWAAELAAKGKIIDVNGLYTMLRVVSRPETITRRRRELFNAGVIDYTTEASNRRMTAYRSEREHAGGNHVIVR